MRLFTWLMVSYHWTFIKQEANIGAKPQPWSIVSLWHQELGECVRTSKSEIFSRCFWILNQRVTIPGFRCQWVCTVVSTRVVWTWRPENLYSQLLGDGRKRFVYISIFLNDRRKSTSCKSDQIREQDKPGLLQF